MKKYKTTFENLVFQTAATFITEIGVVCVCVGCFLLISMACGQILAAFTGFMSEL